MLPFVLLAAAIWGLSIAIFMQFTVTGDFLSKKMTWFMTALGCGGNLLLLLLLVDSKGQLAWWQVVAVFGVSSVAPSLRGILIHKDEFFGFMAGTRQESEDGAGDSVS